MTNTLDFIPRADRTSVDLAVRCQLRGERCRASLCNLTTTGARIEGLAGLRYDEVITLHLPGLKAKRAFVVWVKGDAAGLAFERPIHPDIFADLVRRHARRPATPGLTHAA